MCSVRPGGTLSLITWSRCSRSVPCMGGVCSVVVVVCWPLLAHQWVGLALGPTGYEDWPWPQSMSCHAGADPQGTGFTPVGSVSCWDLLSVPRMELINRVVFCVVEADHQLCWFWGFLGRTGEGQCKMLLVPSLGLLGATRWSTVGSCLC